MYPAGKSLQVLFSLFALCSLFAGRSSAQSEPRPEPEESGDRCALIGSLYLGQEPPELRTLGTIWIADENAKGDARVEGRTREQAVELAARISKQLRDGANWYELSANYSGLRNRVSGGVRGSVPKGALLSELDSFLFSSEVGAISDPVITVEGVFVLQRMETLAGCRVIVVRGTDDDAYRKVDEIRAQLRKGRSFAELAKEFSDHPGSAGRGGQWAIYERGALDTQLKLAVFQAGMNQVGGPLSGGDSLYLFQRVPVEEIDPNLAENNWIRVRSLLLAYDNAPEGLRPNPRSADEAVVLADQLLDELSKGADMAELAARYHDDPTGRERFGDMGWIHKGRPHLPAALLQLWLVEPGAVTRVVDAKIGFGFFRREQ